MPEIYTDLDYKKFHGLWKAGVSVVEVINTSMPPSLCPCCGGLARMDDENHYDEDGTYTGSHFVIMCDDCGLQIHEPGTVRPDIAVLKCRAKWNRRTNAKTT